MALRVEAKEERLLSDVRRRIAAGDLAPGDRILSVKALGKRYAVSQPVVQRALKRLEAEGLIRVIQRTGTFVTENAPALCTPMARTTAIASCASHPPPARHTRDLTAFMAPRPRNVPLSIYILDLHPAALALWEDVLAEAAQALGTDRPEILSCHDGHVEDLATVRPIDLIQTTPAVLEALGRDRFLPFDNLDALGLDPDALLEPVRQALAVPGGLGGVPFSLTLHLLFANERLMATHGLAPPPDHAVADFLDYLRRAETALAGHAARPLRLYQNRAGLFLQAGALSWNGHALALAADRALPLLEILAELPLGVGDANTAVDHFLAQDEVFLQHCTFSMRHFADTAAFPWSAHPLPRDPEGAVASDLTVLAVERQTPRLAECFELIRFLTSAEVQSRFGRLHLNLPVRQAVLDSPDYRQTSPVPMAVLEEQLAAQAPALPPSLWRKAQETLLPVTDLEHLWQGSLRPFEVLERMRLYIQALAPASGEAQPATPPRR